MTELIVGTKKGLFALSGEPGQEFEITTRAFAGEPVDYAIRDPRGGRLCLHSIATWPGDPDRLAVAISAAGVWISEDGGRSWRRGNDGLAARYLPEEPKDEPSPLCVHHMERSPKQPERMFIQFHG